MTDHSQAPTGLARRRRRLTDQETEQRMLRAAVAMVNRTGLTVSLDHISFEEVIRDADVSRSAVYRRWPYKDLFFSDLVMELAQVDATPAIADDEVELIGRVLVTRLDRLDTPDGRRSLAVELFRQLALFDFQTMYGSAGWRTYIALHATFMSLADGELRDRVQSALARSEHHRVVRIATAWQQLTGLFGYRLRPELGTTFEALATLLSANLRGLIIMALTAPDTAGYRAHASPPGAAEAAEWSLAALGLAAIAAAFLEPDPTIEWDDERLTAVRQALNSWVAPDPSPRRPD